MIVWTFSKHDKSLLLLSVVKPLAKANFMFRVERGIVLSFRIIMLSKAHKTDTEARSI